MLVPNGTQPNAIKCFVLDVCLTFYIFSNERIFDVQREMGDSCMFLFERLIWMIKQNWHIRSYKKWFWKCI